MICTCRPCLAASCLTTSKICACGPAVTPTFNGLSCAKAGEVSTAAPRARAVNDLKHLMLMMDLPRETNSAMRHPAYEPVAHALDKLHQDNQHDHDGQHDFRL